MESRLLFVNLKKGRRQTDGHSNLRTQKPFLFGKPYQFNTKNFTRLFLPYKSTIYHRYRASVYWHK